MFETQEHPLAWLSRKQRKSHFHLPGKSSPANNSELLNDGSAQARAILGPTFEGDITWEGAGVRRHALDYLKGKDVDFIGMWTQEIMGEDDEAAIDSMLSMQALEDEDVPPTAA